MYSYAIARGRWESSIHDAKRIILFFFSSHDAIFVIFALLFPTRQRRGLNAAPARADSSPDYIAQCMYKPTAFVDRLSSFLGACKQLI